MSIEASVTRIEAQNRTIAQALIVVLNNQGALAASQKAQSEAIQTLPNTSGTPIDTTELDASIDETDKLIATLAGLVSTAVKSPPSLGTAGTPAPGETPGHSIDAETGKQIDLTDAERARIQSAGPIGSADAVGGTTAGGSTAPGSAPTEAQSAA